MTVAVLLGTLIYALQKGEAEALKRRRALQTLSALQPVESVRFSRIGVGCHSTRVGIPQYYNVGNSKTR